MEPLAGVPPRYTGFDSLHPTTVRLFTRCYTLLQEGLVRGDTNVVWRPFETYRTPERQLFVYNQGKSKALPFRSPHQYGLAVDFVPQIEGRWTWSVSDREWLFLKSCALRSGLDAPISWDKAHVEVPNLWRDVRAALMV